MIPKSSKVKKALQVAFQTIINANKKQVFGYDVQIDMPYTRFKAAPECFFKELDLENSLIPVEQRFLKVAINQYQEQGLSGRLFINLSPQFILKSKKFFSKLNSIKTGELVNEIVVVFEDQLVTSTTVDVRQAFELIKQNNIQTCLDLKGASPDNLKLWTELKPDFVKIDRSYFSTIQHNLPRRQLLQSLKKLSDNSNICLIAKDIEESSQLSNLLSLGINVCQGPYIQTPESHPAKEFEWPVIETLQASEIEQGEQISVASQLLHHEESILITTTLENVVSKFVSRPNIDAFAVVNEQHKVEGIVLRNSVMDLFSGPFGHSINAKKGVKILIENVVVVDQNENIETISHLITRSNNQYKSNIFVIVDADHNYVGTGHFMALLKAITEQNINTEFSNLLEVIRVQSDDKNKELNDLVNRRTEQLLSSNAQLEKTLEELHYAQETLVQAAKLSALGQLVAGVAHEVNTPLGLTYTLITHFREKLAKISELLDSEELTQEDLEGFLAKANEVTMVSEQNLQRAASLIQSFKQVAVDQTHDEPREVSLKKSVEEILTSTQHVFKNSNVKIETYIEPDLEVFTYPGALNQVVTNLVINANLHAFDGRESGLIQISAELMDSEFVKLCVKDNGNGIPEEAKDKIFDPFFTTKRNNGGTGLGLNIVYNLVVSKLFGKIVCESEVGAGTSFIVTVKVRAE